MEATFDVEPRQLPIRWHLPLLLHRGADYMMNVDLLNRPLVMDRACRQTTCELLADGTDSP